MVLVVKIRKKGKAPGPNHIPNTAILRLTVSVLRAMTTLINSILQLGYLPQVWKHAAVVVIPKKGQDPGIFSELPPNHSALKSLKNN